MVGKDLVMATLLGSGGGSSGSGGGEGEKSLLDAMIDGSITEISNNTVASVWHYAFFSRQNLSTVQLKKVTAVGAYAFSDCLLLTSVDMPKLSTVAEYGFEGCTHLQDISLDNVTSIGSYGFEKCYALKKDTALMLPKCEKIGSYAFRTCSGLTKVVAPIADAVPTYCFSEGSALRTADFPAAASIGTRAFASCFILTALLLRNETMVPLANTNAFLNCYHILGTVNAAYNPDGLKDGYIYVPRSLVDTYKAATNWSTYADQFRALEDYTVDGTITGELDESKI